MAYILLNITAGVRFKIVVVYLTIGYLFWSYYKVNTKQGIRETAITRQNLIYNCNFLLAIKIQTYKEQLIENKNVEFLNCNCEFQEIDRGHSLTNIVGSQVSVRLIINFCIY